MPFPLYNNLDSRSTVGTLSPERVYGEIFFEAKYDNLSWAPELVQRKDP